MNFLRLLLLLCLLALPTVAAPNVSTPLTDPRANMFPFALPPFDDAKTATDVSWMNSTPAGANGFIKSQGEHFVDGAGNMMRFWGVNLNFNGVFPPKEQAPGIAARLAKFGFNAVRIHHYDGNAAPTGIWKAAGEGSSRLKMPREFDADQLDRFDFFMSELIKRGIYIDLNMHVGRKVLTEEGYPRASFLPEKDKGVNYFDEKLISAHQDFARQILQHVNPYTGRAYADEPGVCAVEVTNENSILGMWLDGSFSKIPEPYAKPLLDKWNAWLKARYDDASLRAAWTERGDALNPNDILALPYPSNIVNPYAPDARLTIGMNSMRRFKFKADTGAQAELDLDPLGGPTINGFVRPGLSTLLKSLGDEKWGFQIFRDGLNLQEGRPYTLSFWARSDTPRRISVNFWKDQQPYDFLGFNGFADLSTEWQQYSFVFRPFGPEPGHSRLTFNFGASNGTVQLAEISLQAGGKLATPSSWTLTNGVPLIDLRTTQVQNVRRDFAEFLGEIESAYVTRMRTFLKKDMGVRCPIWNTQAQFGGWGGLWRERDSDAVDVHAYWKHPTFSGNDWSTTDWKVENTSMTGSPALDPLSGFSYFRLKGKPFVMTEWNSGQPSDFGQESLLMAAAYAAWQDWAGVYIFDYHSIGNFDRDYFKGFFSIDSHPAKMATAPAAALIFRRPQSSNEQADADPQPIGQAHIVTTSSAQTEQQDTPGQVATVCGDVLTAKHETNLTIPPNLLWSKVAASSGQPTPALVLPAWREAGASRSAALLGKVYVNFGEAPFVMTDGTDPDPKNLWVSDTRQIRWSKQPPLFVVNAPCSKIAAGFLGGYGLAVGEWKINAAAGGNNFQTLALSSLDGLPLAQSRRVLLTATGRAENIDMGWNLPRDSVGKEWGKGPTLVEGLSAGVQFLTDATQVKVYALSPIGERVAEVPCTLSNGTLEFSIAPRWKTLWYEIASE